MTDFVPPETEQEALRRSYLAFRFGARLDTTDVSRLLASRGHQLSNNRLRNLGLDTDRGRSISAFELHALISAWSDEQAQRGPSPSDPQG